MEVLHSSPTRGPSHLIYGLILAVFAVAACDQPTHPLRTPVSAQLNIQPCPDSIPDCYSPPPEPFDNSGYGLTVWADEDPAVYDRANSLAERAHASWVRVQFNWDDLQPSGPTMDAAKLQFYRNFVTNATSHHLAVYPILMRSPAWVRTHYPVGNACRTNAQCPPDPDSWMWWRMFADSMARLFPEVDVWGIWNEPNDTSFLPLAAATGLTDRVNIYGYLLGYASDAIHTYGKKVAGPELGTGATDGTSASQWFGDYFRRWAYRGDILTVHKYDSATGVIAAMKAYGDTARFGPWPLWLTEVGIENTTETYRAQFLTDVFQGMESHVEPLWKRTFYFALYNGWPTATTYEIVHGMFTTAPQPLLGYYCFQALASGQTPLSACQ
jgi:hypothetical protein